MVPTGFLASVATAEVEADDWPALSFIPSLTRALDQSDRGDVVTVLHSPRA